MHSVHVATLIAVVFLGQCLTEKQVDYQIYRQLARQLFAQWNASAGKPDSDMALNVTQLITTKGYQCENHESITSDGYILSLQRIPCGRRQMNCSAATKRPVVFLQHGLLDSSATWVMNSGNESLGFILADAGYDVWLGNVRGNTYSKRHVHLKSTDPLFWQWSWDEMVKYDIPAMINYTLSTSNMPELFYIGHSQGSLIAFTSLAQNKQLAKRVKALIGLGPVYTVTHLKGLVRLMVDALPEEEFLLRLFGVREFLPTGSVTRFLAQDVCGNRIGGRLCETLVFLISGFNYKQLNTSRLPVYFTHTPAGTSVKNMIHFAQMVRGKSCRAFDYGSDKLNFLHYNQSIPPEYDVTPLSVPTYLFSGTHDWLADPEDVSELYTRLKCAVSHEMLPGWEHLDFIWSLDAAYTLYPKILTILRSSITS